MSSGNGNVANRDLILTKQRMYNLYFNSRMCRKLIFFYQCESHNIFYDENPIDRVMCTCNKK